MRNKVSGYGGLKSIAKKPDGGFCFIRVRSLLAAWIRFNKNDITLYDLRLWLACHEMLARRCKMKTGRLPTFSESELISLVSSGDKCKARQGIKRLVKAGLLHWEQNCISANTLKAEMMLAENDDWSVVLSLIQNNRRRVPVPRRILCYIIKTRHRTLIGTVFGHLLRCLYYRRDRCVSGGRCKASWISEALKLDLRNVKAARKQLIEIGWILPCRASQISLNRWGLPIMINLEWENTQKTEELKTPLLRNRNEVKTPSLIDRKLSYSKRIKNHELRKAPGVQNRTQIGSESRTKHIMLEDLEDPVRLDAIYRQECAAGTLRHCQANRLKFFAAAERALSEGKHNPCGLFAVIYRKKLWHHITQDQEDRARVKLKVLDFGEVSRLPGELHNIIPQYNNIAA